MGNLEAKTCCVYDKQIHKVYKILFESQKKLNDGKLRKTIFYIE